MLIYTKRSRLRNCTKNNLSAKVSELESMQLIIQKLNKSHITAFKTNGDLLIRSNFKNEDVEAHCITAIKHLLRTVHPNILNSFCNSSEGDFPVLKYLLKYSHHPDIMIRNAARISLMCMFQKYEGCNMQYVIFQALSNHINDVLEHIKKAALDMQDYYAKSNMKAIKVAMQCYQQEFEYIDDILKLNLKNKNATISKILNDFVQSFIYASIVDDPIAFLSPVCRRIGLCLLDKLLESITDFDMNECIIRSVLNKTPMPKDVNTNELQINKSLLLILLKEKTNIDTLLVLNIFHKLQIYILERNTIILGEFYHKIFFPSMKLMKTNNQSHSYIECLKLKLIISIFQPLIQRNAIHDSNYIKLKELFLQNLEILYEEITAKIRQNITLVVDIIDEKYEEFSSTKLDRNKIFTHLNFFENPNVVNRTTDSTKLELYHLFCIRLLYLEAKRTKEKCLPIIEKKEKIGDIIDIDNCLPCEKFIGDAFYQKGHFVKMTDRQLLILQSAENKTDGIIIFNPYYKDIMWSVNKNNSLKICDIKNCSSDKYQILSKLYFIHIKFTNADNLKFVTDILSKAKESQIRTMKRKLRNILLIREGMNLNLDAI